MFILHIHYFLHNYFFTEETEENWAGWISSDRWLDRNEWEANGWIDWNFTSSSSWQTDNESEWYDIIHI